MPGRQTPTQGQNAPREQDHAPVLSPSHNLHVLPTNSEQMASTSDDPDMLRGSKSKSMPKDTQSKRTKHFRQGNGRQLSSQSLTKSQENKQGTPVKTAYAGPTFHSSPAPSALPMPSFLSKSVPEVSTTASKPLPEETESLSESSTSLASVNEDDSAPGLSSEPTHREPSPLDFLFDAARQARGTPNPKTPPAFANHLSPNDESPSRRAQSAKNLSNAPVAPFELDGSSNDSHGIGPSFATPYQERMNALRVSRSESPTNSNTLDESERKAKTEALKNLLMKSQQIPPTSTSPNLQEQSNHSSMASSAPLRNGYHRSGPATPVPHPPDGHVPESQGQPASNPFQSGNATSRPDPAVLHTSPPPATATHRVRLSSPRYTPAPSRFPQYEQSQSPPPPARGIPGASVRVLESDTPSRRVLSPKMLEDDLRRVLRLDH